MASDPNEFDNIFAAELSGFTDDQVVALCGRHLADRLTALENAGQKARKVPGKGTGQLARAAAEDLGEAAESGSEEDPAADGEDPADEDSAGDDSHDDAGDEDAEGDNEDAMFAGGDLDEAEQEQLLAMEAEEAESGDEEGDARLLARFEREDLPFDSLKFDDFLDPGKRPGDRPPEDHDEEEAAGKAAGPKSKFERSQERLGHEIAALEESLVRPAPWQLRGEVEAADRPEGGLLEEDLDFDHIGRPRPLASEELEAKLQELVKTRIKSAAFDSAARKQRPEERPAEYRKALLLDSDKPRPLAEVYEQEFAKQQEAAEAKSQPRHDEIRRDLNSLLARLDRLSGLHFAPQNPLPRVRVVSGAPALSMEEVRGTAVSGEASQLAPEQAGSGKAGRRAGHEIGDSERSRTDRLRRRRKAKAGKRARLQRAAVSGKAGPPAGGERAAALAQLKQQARKPGSRVRILAA